MTISSTIILEEAEDVVAVPINAVTTKDGKNYVTVVNNGETEEVEIELGIADDEYVQILAGVEENNTIQITTTTTESTIRNTSTEEENTRSRDQSSGEMMPRNQGTSG